MNNEKLCCNCSNFINAKPMPRCDASKYTDLITGDNKRTCLIERMDGVGRCGSMSNNYTEAKPKPKPARTNPMKKIDKK